MVHVPAGISGARVSIDGRDVAPGQPVDVDPGTRSVRVRAPGRLDFVEEVSASEARQIEIHARLDPETSPSPETVRPAPARNVPTSDRRVSVADGSGGPPAGAIVVGGLGLTLATVGFLIRQRGASDYDDASAACAGGCPTQDLVDRGNDARRDIELGNLGIAAGAGALAVASVWWILATSSSRATPEPAKLAVSAGPRAGSIRFEGRF